jgi:hypothetical protein
MFRYVPAPLGGWAVLEVVSPPTVESFEVVVGCDLCSLRDWWGECMG